MSKADSAADPDLTLSEEDRASILEAVRRARAQARKVRGVPHAKVREWLLSLDTENPLPRPRGEPID